MYLRRDMDGHGRRTGVERRSPEEEPDVVVTACETRPGRVVFTEEENTDAWIATDLAVDIER